MESKDKKRILFIITLNEIGGAQRFLNTVINSLDPGIYDLSVAAGENSTGEFLRSFREPVKTYLVKNLKRNPNIISDIRAIFEIRELINRVEPNVIFLNSSKAGFLGSVAAPKGVKVIYRIGGWTFNDPWPKWKKWLYIQLEKLSAKWKDIIILNNEYDLDQAQKLKIKPREELVLIHNGIDPYKMEFLSKDESRLKLFERISKHSGKIFQTKYIVGTIANFYPTKGIKYLIKAAQNFKDREDTAFIVIGDGEERSKYESQIKDLGLENKFFLVGQLADAHKYLQAFDIFILPSVKEGFPWALMEAMSAKLPVIATAVGAVPEILEDEKNGFIIEPSEPEQIAKSISQLLDDDHRKLEFGIQAHQTVIFKFGLDKMLSQIQDLL